MSHSGHDLARVLRCFGVIDFDPPHCAHPAVGPRARLGARRHPVREDHLGRTDRLRTRGARATTSPSQPASAIEEAVASRTSPVSGSSAGLPSDLVRRPTVRGKFLFVGDTKLHVRGVTYGAFEPDAEAREYQDVEKVERDFAQMAAHGINAVRIPHTTPPRTLLDAAARHGLHVMVGLSAEQYLGFLIDRRQAPDVAALIRAKVRACAGHPALLCYGLGNEIPAPMARWLGRRKVEHYLERMYRVVKDEDPDGLVTYVNYPTTEYLRLPFLDLLCFNVYLESPERLDAYLARLQNLAGDRPLVMSELGLDSLRNGEDVQARSLDWQVRTAFAAGSAGVFVFSWTDEWYRHGQGVGDWAFGLTRADRSPKPALGAVREAFAEVPLPPQLPWPRVSVVVCTYNGARTIRDCLDGLSRLVYPAYEVIVVDDGSSEAIGGFDPQFRTAGDDVDVCWRLQERGWKLGFHPAAMVWHHRRNSVRTYWRQQIGYGRAEAMLERKWPEKYNGPGHVRWVGRMYGDGLTHALGWRRSRVYHGVWGGAPFQSLYQPAPSLLGSLPQMPEWHLITASLAGIAALSAAWRPFKLAFPLLAVAIVPPVAQAWLSAARAAFPDGPAGWSTRLRRRLLTAALHLIQPLARLRGRLNEGLTPWRRRGTPGPTPLWPVTASIWSDQARDQDQRLRTMEADLRVEGACVLRGGRHDPWDLEVRGGFFGAARFILGVEDHPSGHQMLRLRWWPVVPVRGPILTLVFAALTYSAVHDHAWVAAAVVGPGAAFFAWRVLEQCTAAMATVRDAVARLRDRKA